MCLPSGTRLAAAGSHSRPQSGISKCHEWAVGAGRQRSTRRTDILWARYSQCPIQGSNAKAHYPGQTVHPRRAQADFRHCLEDADDLVRLLPKMLPHIDLGVALYRGESVGCLALIDHRGPPIDMANFAPLADARAWARYAMTWCLPSTRSTACMCAALTGN